jgi:hypothetical protein
MCLIGGLNAGFSKKFNSAKNPNGRPGTLTCKFDMIKFYYDDIENFSHTEQGDSNTEEDTMLTFILPVADFLTLSTRFNLNTMPGFRSAVFYKNSYPEYDMFLTNDIYHFSLEIHLPIYGLWE